MADIDIDPFGDHDKMDTWPDETDETIHLNPGGVVEGRIYLGTRTRNIIWWNEYKDQNLKRTC